MSTTPALPLVRPALHRDLHVTTAADPSLTPLAPTFVELLRDVARDVAG